MRTHDEVVYAFTNQGKLTPGQTQRILRLEIAFKDLATEIIEMVPDSADRTSALRKLLEAKMMCSQAISHNAPAEETLNKKSK